MELKIDETIIQSSLNDASSAAIANAMSSYQVRSAIEERVANAVLEGVLIDAIHDAISRIDIEKLTESLAAELARSVTSGAVHIIRESVIDIMLRLRKVPEYDSAKTAAARCEIEMRVFGK